MAAGERPTLEVIERRPEQETAKPPILFVHGLGHGAWCWHSWMGLAAEAGYPSWALSLRGHGHSDGRLLRSHLGSYVDDVLGVAALLPEPPIVVGHSLGGLVVQRALARLSARAVVLVAPVAARSGWRVLLKIGSQHPADVLKIMAGGSLPLRQEYLFEGLEGEAARRYLSMTGGESPWAQFQVLLHRPSARPLGEPPVLLLATPDDNLIPAADLEYTARHQGAEVHEFPGIGHDLMLDQGWQKPGAAMIAWLDQLS